MPSKLITITKEQVDYVNQIPLDLSKFIQKKLNEEIEKNGYTK